MTDSIQSPTRPRPPITDWPGMTCLGRTCLKWGDDGELTSVDLLLVLERLDCQPCPSLS